MAKKEPFAVFDPADAPPHGARCLCLVDYPATETEPAGEKEIEATFDGTRGAFHEPDDRTKRVRPKGYRVLKGKSSEDSGE